MTNQQNSRTENIQPSNNEEEVVDHHLNKYEPTFSRFLQHLINEKMPIFQSPNAKMYQKIFLWKSTIFHSIKLPSSVGIKYLKQE